MKEPAGASSGLKPTPYESPTNFGMGKSDQMLSTMVQCRQIDRFDYGLGARFRPVRCRQMQRYEKCCDLDNRLLKNELLELGRDHAKGGPCRNKDIEL